MCIPEFSGNNEGEPTQAGIIAEHPCGLKLREASLNFDDEGGNNISGGQGKEYGTVICMESNIFKSSLCETEAAAKSDDSRTYEHMR